MDQNLIRPEIIRKDQKDLEMIGNGVYIGEEYYYNGKPFNGFVVYDYYDNGNIQFEVEHADGQTMGWWVEYYENGTIEYERLHYGANIIFFQRFDEQGNITEGGWVSSKEYYNEIAKKTGMEPMDL